MLTPSELSCKPPHPHSRLETLREELPAEVQRLEKSCEEKWQQQMEAGWNIPYWG